jgi:hypothetical protein
MLAVCFTTSLTPAHLDYKGGMTTMARAEVSDLTMEYFDLIIRGKVVSYVGATLLSVKAIQQQQQQVHSSREPWRDIEPLQ